MWWVLRTEKYTGLPAGLLQIVEFFYGTSKQSQRAAWRVDMAEVQNSLYYCKPINVVDDDGDDNTWHSVCDAVITRVHSVHLMNAEQYEATELDRESAFGLPFIYTYHWHL